MRAIHDYLRELAAGLELDDTPTEEEIKNNPLVVKKPTTEIEVTTKSTDKDKPEETKKIPVVKPDEASKDFRQAKRPDIKPPRRQQSFRNKWTGIGSREVRKDYQKQYRQEHGNGYVKKIKLGYDDQEYIVRSHEAYKV